MMELEVDTCGLLEEANFEAGDDFDAAASGNEKCGICMDIIIDRGVLDCCQHWFCFACIDNWATITNLCPLCQNEFQLITCIPVYDTIGSSKVEDSLPRDDDWCIQGKNNTLSFPSYYIDENAVICLDGDGCKIRSGLAAVEEDSNLDTSIACDSCDLWYHAFCVGFAPEGTSENSWLCPRCVTDEVPQKSDGISTQRPSNKYGPEIAAHDCLVDATFSGKVSVSVADAGETAVVVSMVEEMHWTEEPSENFLSFLDVEKDTKTETFVSDSKANSPKLETQLKETTNIQPNVGVQETSLALSLSHDTSFTLHCNSLANSELVTESADETICEPNGSDKRKMSSHPSVKLYIKNEHSESEASIDLHLGLSVGSSLSVDKTSCDATETQMAGNVRKDNPLEESSLSVDNMDADSSLDVGITGVKRKCTSSRNAAQMDDYTEHEDREASAEFGTEDSAKKARPEEKSQMIPLRCQVNDSASDDTLKFSNLPAVSKYDKLQDDPEKEADILDIMSIVRSTDKTFSEGAQCEKPTDKSSGERENAAGLRVKKIMRRAAEDKESSTLVQKLREEIRETVRKKSSIDFSKNNFFDPKLLAAFRAAIAGPRTEPVKKLNPSIVRVKKSMLQKGKIRENLTKKIYGTGGGRRRRAWDRDWEIEFWKHRCLRTTKPEKVETLKSVLDLLRKGSEMEQESEWEGPNPILSRLYLADTSVFPRKDDIKPLAALTSVGNCKQNNEHNLVEKVSQPIYGNSKVQSPSQSQTSKGSAQISSSSFENKGKKGCAPSLKGEVTCRNMHPNGPTKGPNTASLPASSKLIPQTTKEMAGKSDDVKIDKRKWALEVLARKTAVVDRDSTQGKQGDVAMLKGNYPLLAKLPTDMRPVLAPSRHNKVPMSVRQAQLYRLTEHFLRKANLPVIRRTADTELAVADAVNIEKEVADKSNSKLVYVNLCSQVLLQHANNTKPIGAPNSNPSTPSADPTESTEPAPKGSPSDPVVEEALRMAGLLSDSPPNSPYCPTKDLDDEDDASKTVTEEGPESVFDMDSHPELDIYGDFEYDLEDEDYIGTSALRTSMPQPEEDSPKMKVVFSTLNAERTETAPDSNDLERLQIVEAQMDSDSPCNLKCLKDGGMGIPTLEVKRDAPFPPPEPLLDEGDEEPSLAECEELYGPDKKPLVERFPEKASKESDKLVGKEASTENIVSSENESCRSNKAARSSKFGSESCLENVFVTGRFPAHHCSSGGEKSPNCSLASENVQRKEMKPNNNQQSDLSLSISKKVEVYIKEHIRPLCKSGVITAEQYRWTVGKTTEKVMKYHFKAKNANFLIKEGEKIKKLAEQYVEASQKKEPQ